MYLKFIRFLQMVAVVLLPALIINACNIAFMFNLDTMKIIVAVTMVICAAGFTAAPHLSQKESARFVIEVVSILGMVWAVITYGGTLRQGHIPPAFASAEVFVSEMLLFVVLMAEAVFRVWINIIRGQPPKFISAIW